MSNEGEYLELVNDLRDQYITMKETLSREIAFKNEQLRYLEEELGRKPALRLTTYQFYSNRPTADSPVYSAIIPERRFYYCNKCSLYHPNQSICHI